MWERGTTQEKPNHIKQDVGEKKKTNQTPKILNQIN